VECVALNEVWYFTICCGENWPIKILGEWGLDATLAAQRRVRPRAVGPPTEWRQPPKGMEAVAAPIP